MRSVNSLFFLLLILCMPLQAQDLPVFSNTEHKARFQTLIEELRCLVCQNQSLADSDAELAQDLRAQVLTMLEQGHSDQEILEFMVARYGDFVLYRPPVKSTTAFLWFGPFILAGVAIIAMFIFLFKRNKKQITPEISDAQRKRATALLDGSE